MEPKDYLIQQYKNARSDYELARTEDQKWEALKSMGRLEALAAELYGFAFADSLAAESNRKTEHIAKGKTR